MRREPSLGLHLCFRAVSGVSKSKGPSALAPHGGLVVLGISQELVRKAESQVSSSCPIYRGQGDSASALLTFGRSRSLSGAVLGIVGCLAAS